MSTNRASTDPDADGVPMTATYIRVVVLEVVVLVALWLFQRYFS